MPGASGDRRAIVVVLGGIVVIGLALAVAHFRFDAAAWNPQYLRAFAT